MEKSLQRLAYAIPKLGGAKAIKAFGSAHSVACKQRSDNIVGKNDRTRMEKQIELAGVRDFTVHRLDLYAKNNFGITECSPVTEVAGDAVIDGYRYA